MNVVHGWRHDAMIAFLLGSQHVTTSHSETEEGQKMGLHHDGDGDIPQREIQNLAAS